jgi:hypothetical protein
MRLWRYPINVREVGGCRYTRNAIIEEGVRNVVPEDE